MSLRKIKIVLMIAKPKLTRYMFLLMSFETTFFKLDRFPNKQFH